MKLKISLKTLNIYLVCLLCIIYIFGNIYAVANSKLLISFFDIIDKTILILLIVSILTSSYRAKMFAGVCVLTAYMMVCYIWTGLFDLLRAEIIILALRDASAKKTYKMLFRTFLISLLVIFVLYILGISNAGETRRGSVALGFGTPNIASKMIQTTIFLWIIYTANHRSNFANILYIISVIFVWFTTGSRNSTILIAVFPLCLFLVKKIANSKYGGGIQYICYFLPILLTVITGLLSQMYDKYTWIQGLNALFSNRIYMNKVAIQNYGYSLIGQAANLMDYTGIFDAVSQKYVYFLTIDSFYVYVFVYYGIVGLIITLFTIIATMRKAWNKKNYVILTIMFLLCIYSLTETTSSVFCLPSLLYVFLNDDISTDITRKGKKI